jgi:hypothetical protein
VDEIEDERDLDPMPVDRGPDLVELLFMSIDQHQPRALPLGVSPQRLLKDLLGHLLGRPLDAGPHPFVARSRLGRVFLAFHTHDRLGRPNLPLDAVHRRHRRHALAVHPVPPKGITSM